MSTSPCRGTHAQARHSNISFELAGKVITAHRVGILLCVGCSSCYLLL
jgi:hypothetical protein